MIFLYMQYLYHSERIEEVDDLIEFLSKMDIRAEKDKLITSYFDILYQFNLIIEVSI